MIDAAGVGCEPASAASVAGVAQLRREGVIRAGERVVAVLTGHLLKDPGALVRYHQETEPPPARANRPIEIEPRVEEVRRVLAKRAGLIPKRERRETLVGSRQSEVDRPSPGRSAAGRLPTTRDWRLAT